jgi:aryl carrier-like protein
LSNGEKFNPVPTEKTVESHPLVYGALMVGQGKEQPALIIEPEKDVTLAAQDLIDAIWPLLQEANSRAPAHGRVSRSMILVSDAGKPFARAGKGTIVRKLSVAAFSKEVDKLYSDNEYAVNDVPLLDPPYDQPAIQSFVKTAFKSYLPEDELGDESDFFVLGLDSLQTLEYISRLKAGLRAHPQGGKSSWLSAKTIYANPTIKALSQEFDDRLNLEDEISSGIREHDAERISRMSAIVDEHTRAILNVPSVPKERQRHSATAASRLCSQGQLDH